MLSYEVDEICRVSTCLNVDMNNNFGKKEVHLFRLNDNENNKKKKVSSDLMDHKRISLRSKQNFTK
jgi:hypothetical protein